MWWWSSSSVIVHYTLDIIQQPSQGEKARVKCKKAGEGVQSTTKLLWRTTPCILPKQGTSLRDGIHAQKYHKESQTTQEELRRSANHLK
ncbi:hypothetical protein ABVT39_007666 [Epinephelus coioides]